MTVKLCGVEGCRKKKDHDGEHDLYPSRPWSFLGEKDKNKLTKAGWATPRGGSKGAYQNHVLRTNKVIIPFERIQPVSLEDFQDGYVIRIFPDQYFSGAGVVKDEFSDPNAPQVGENAFILYRTHDQFRDFPPLPEWQVRWLEFDGERVEERRPGVVDQGEYVLRIATHGSTAKREEGPPQGIFAPEYANAESNYISKCVLAWLTAHTVDASYVAAQADWLEVILNREGLFDLHEWERLGLLRSGHTACPLCMRLIRYEELHDQVNFSDENSLLNASEQVLNATRSTIVNLFHMNPLIYSSIEHGPRNVAWGHATCNTKLGQRKCYSMTELIEQGVKVGTVDEKGVIYTFGWSSQNMEMMRSPRGSVWIRISDEHLTEEE